MTSSLAGLDVGLLDMMPSVLFGVFVFLWVMSLCNMLLARRHASRRVQQLTTYRRELARAGTTRFRSRQWSEGANRIKRVIHGAKLLQDARAERVKLMLASAGYRTREALVTYSLAKVMSLAISLLVLIVLMHGVLNGASGGLLWTFAALGCTMAGLVGPNLFLSNRTAKRRLAIERSLPDCLDLLMICAEAGLSLDAALNRVAEESREAAPQLADELALTSIELNFLPERKMALLNLARRVDIGPVRGLVNTLSQTERYGTPLSQALRVLSSELREQRMLRAEEKAARLPALLTVPMILFILPALFAVIMGPAVLDIYDNLMGK